MKITRRQFGLGAAVLSAGPALPALAANEVNEVRFARQLGLGYLQLYVMQELNLVEKHAASLGLPNLKATYRPLGSPAAINDALLANTVDYGAAGVTPFIILWDKTRANIKVKAVGGLNAQPAFLNSNNPAIKSLHDFTEKDRIAVPAVKLSLQAILLQMAAEKTFGPGQQNRLDHLTVSLAHPDGTAALLAGRTEITAHFTSPPFQYQQLQDPKIHRVLSSYDITDGPASFSAIWATEKFRATNPTVHKAVVAALEEATRFINENHTEAAKIFIKLDNSKLPLEFVVSQLKDPDIIFSTAPRNFEKFSDFLHRIGSIQAKPTWRDLVFEEAHSKAGS
ncbi:ABC transporter substrate-binding protein [Ferrovibrio sp.]|uniref:ABC transporter substrate-binding protein n=1 Tax=Ferrovibrio sp. TaxID=1917215 RepID=UPI0025C24306|nr:ABC transporter substrate-binding protein [Ferrovibrio sp.]MBX3452895.1 ABC transporter substrate-binding protein [Ferrovibrio sp.]